MLTNTLAPNPHRERETERDGETERRSERERDREGERLTDTERETERERERETQREREWKNKCRPSSANAMVSTTTKECQSISAIASVRKSRTKSTPLGESSLSLISLPASLLSLSPSLSLLSLSLISLS